MPTGGNHVVCVAVRCHALTLLYVLVPVQILVPHHTANTHSESRTCLCWVENILAVLTFVRCHVHTLLRFQQSVQILFAKSASCCASLRV